MISLIEPTLYMDEQQQSCTCICEVCGGVRYAPGFACLRCERRAS